MAKEQYVVRKFIIIKINGERLGRILLIFIEIYAYLRVVGKIVRARKRVKILANNSIIGKILTLL